MRRNISALLCGACAFAVTLSAPASAQNPAAGVSVDGEIIVTARKRQESILKVPVVANVISSQTLVNYAITDMNRLTTKVPGLLFGIGSLGTGLSISIRGVGTTAQDQGLDQSVALNIDGLAVTHGLAFRAGLFDLQQLEVLKGPQALFFGKNSPGGVISMRTNDPGSALEIIARTGYEGEAREWRSELILSGPVTDSFGVRLAGQYSDMKGFFRNKAVALPGAGGLNPKYKRLDNTKSYVVRGTAVWKPTADFSARLKMNITKDNIRGSGGNPNQLVFCPDGITGPSGVQFIAPADNCKLDRTINIVDIDPAAFPALGYNGVPFFLLKQKFGTLTLDYSPADTISLTSVTGYYRNTLASSSNSTGTGFAGGVLVVENAYRRRDVTQEIRAETSFDSPVNFSTGLFYQDSSISSRLRFNGRPGAGFPALLSDDTAYIKVKTYSAYGQARWKILPQLEIAGGARYTDEGRRADGIIQTTGVVRAVTVGKPKISSKTWSPELTITYTPTDELTVFGSLKQGYKSGSYSLGRALSAGFDNSFGDERVRGGEIGLKARLLDRKLFLNLAAYQYKYNGLQVGAVVTTPTGVPIPGTKVVNAGGSKIYGVDFDWTYRTPIDGLSLNGSINYTHARFTTLNNAPCSGGQTVAEGCNQLLNPATGRFNAQDLSGAPLVRAPDWQVAGGFDYETEVGSGLKANFGADGRYTSRYAGSLDRRSVTYQKGYFQLNANVAMGDSDDRWKVQLIANNITNKIVTGAITTTNSANGVLFGGTITGGTTRGIAGIDEAAGVANRGRELWIRLTLKPVGLFR